MRNRWLNQYIPLVSSRPDLILSETREGFDAQQLAKFKEALGVSREVYVEIGSGSGGHLLIRAKEDPEALFVGLELRYKRAYRTIEKAEQQGLSNVRLARADARLLSELFDPESVSGVYVNFPDPWAKDRWKKHRLLSSEFLGDIAQHLHENGFLSFKTDHHEYFHEVLEHLQQSPHFLVEYSTVDLFESPLAELSRPTEFEQLFRSKGLPIAFLQARKSG